MAFPLLGLGIGAGLLGGLFGGMSAKSRGNEYAKLFGEQRDYSRGRFGETEATGQAGMNKTGDLLKNITQWDRGAVGEARGLAAGQLNKTGDFFKSRIGQVQKQIDQVGQTARQDIADQGAKQGAATASNLSRRGLGSSTMLAGAQAQNQQATGRSLSSLAEGMAGVRGAATERTTGDLANFMQFRSQYEPGLALQGREFVRQGDQGLAQFMQGRTAFETGLKDSHTQADNTLLMNLINAAAGSKGSTSGAIGNTLGGLGNLMFLGGLGAFGN